MSQNDFAGLHVVVTGASSGIGKSTALKLAARGATLTLVARRAEALAELVAECQAVGASAIAAPADVGDKAALLSALDKAEAENGPIDALFANAGTGGNFAPLQDYTDDDFDTVLTTNLTSVFWALKRVFPGMVERKRGAVLVTGSLASERGMANNVAYVASKHGVQGLARAAALEGAPHNVRVNCVIPGFIETPMLTGLAPEGQLDALRAQMGKGVPQGRIGSSDELAEAAVFMLSPAASHITGQSLVVDGGILGTLSV